MAMLRFITSTSSKAIPYARRALSGSMTKAAFSSEAAFSSDSKKQIDGKLVKIIKSEIKLKQQTFQERDIEASTLIPDDLPFSIKDNPWESHVTLSRDFHGEKIEVIVKAPVDGEYSYDAGQGLMDEWLDDSRKWLSKPTYNSDSDSDAVDESPDLTLWVTICKNGILLIIYTYVSAHGRMSFFGYDVEIQEFPKSVSEFWYKDVSPDMKEFLRVRGITKSNYAFLFEYMYKKYEKYPVVALKKLTNFIAE